MSIDNAISKRDSHLVRRSLGGESVSVTIPISFQRIKGIPIFFLIFTSVPEQLPFVILYRELCSTLIIVLYCVSLLHVILPPKSKHGHTQSTVISGYDKVNNNNKKMEHERLQNYPPSCLHHVFFMCMLYTYFSCLVQFTRKWCR